jgi:hypothetical protein
MAPPLSSGNSNQSPGSLAPAYWALQETAVNPRSRNESFLPPSDSYSLFDHPGPVCVCPNHTTGACSYATGSRN